MFVTILLILDLLISYVWIHFQYGKAIDSQKRGRWIRKEEVKMKSGIFTTGKLVFCGIICLLIVAGACYLWYNHSIAPYEKDLVLSQELFDSYLQP